MNFLASLPPVLYLISSVMFTLGIKRLSKVKTARQGNTLAALAMLLAVIGTALELGWVDPTFILGGLVVGTAIGAWTALTVKMTAMPEMVALFNGSGGAASALVALASYAGLREKGLIGTGVKVFEGGTLPAGVQVFVLLGSIVVGAVTLSGSLVAWGKLQGRLAKGKPILLPARHALSVALLMSIIGVGVWFGVGTAEFGTSALWIVTGLSLLLGGLLVLPIGGADMPVVVSLLNSYSGIAAAAAGFLVGNPVLVVAGTMVGAAGLILTRIMSDAMNRSLANVLVGGFGQTDAAGGAADEGYEGVTQAGPEEAAMILEGAQSVIIVPGYGLAVAQAQHVCKELGELLIKRGVQVSYAIHPVAGRMPGHMNVLLAEADVPYDLLYDMDAIAGSFKQTDVCIVVGANDVVNPAAANDPSSPIFGMPILPAHEAQTVMVIKRSLSPGYAGIKNSLFEADNTLMLFADAKKMLTDLVAEVKEL